MKVIIFVVFLADGAEGVFGVGPGKDLNEEVVTSWLCFSRESLICFWWSISSCCSFLRRTLRSTPRMKAEV